MQTFLPYPDYKKTAEVLDSVRLGNQCWREVKTLLNGGWMNHPASKMWLEYDCQHSLCEYGMALAGELYNRGYAKSGIKYFNYYYDEAKKYRNVGFPPWIGYEPFHSAHRSNLLRKDWRWYSQFNWLEPPDLPYIWPILSYYKTEIEK